VTAANALTLIRAVLVLPVVWLIGVGDFREALVVFLLAAATDALDGAVARRRDGASELGAALDPLADKVLVLGALTALAVRGAVPWWALAAIGVREVLAIEIRARHTVAATADGKAKTVLQVAAVAALLVAAAWPAAGVDALAAGLLGAALALTLASGVRLLLRARQTRAHAA
jgi:CDP-diacylglycerol--glycerol-3-phosphate 3-phosphatidyltransferase